MKLRILLATIVVMFSAGAIPTAESFATTSYTDRDVSTGQLVIIDQLGNEKFMVNEYPEMKCLALNVYYEARSSSLADQYSVADVVLNRVQDRRYPNSICAVVQQGKQKPSWKDPNKMVMVRNMCQFSWYCDGKADEPQDTDSWTRAQMIAWNIYYHNKYRGMTESATHYHAEYVNPKWASQLQLVGRIGSHIYYRWEK